MSSVGSFHEKIVWSTRDFPEKERVEIWRDAMVRSAFPIDVTPLSGRELEGRAALFTLGDIVICEGAASGAVYRSVSGNHATDSVLLVLHDRSRALYNLNNNEMQFGADQAGVLTSATKGEIKIDSYRCATVCLPRRMLAPLVADIDAATLRTIDGGNDATRLLRRYLRIVGTHPPAGAAGQLVADHIRDLAALVVGATRDGADQACGGVAVARLAALKADCMAHFDRPEFSIGQLAVRAGLSPRSVRALFESDGTTFTDFVRAARLERARRLLADPQFDSHRIASIAYESGFSDLSYFNRCFRHRYGLTPSDFRASVRQDGQRKDLPDA